MKKSSVFSYFIVFFFAIVSCDSNKNESNALFETVSSNHTNIEFRNIVPVNTLTNSFVYEYVHNGAGVAVGDVNNDGLEDIYFTSNLEDNQLYLNLGDFKFKNITEESKTSGSHGWATGTNMVDINNDGLLDIYVCRSGPYGKAKLLVNELFINTGVNSNGIPVFKEAAKEYGLNATTNSIQSAFFDFDLDGDLDMYLMNHNPHTHSNGARDKFSYLGDKFYVNENGKYVDKTAEVGIYSNSITWGLGIGISDLNLDGWPDVYISNDYDEPDYMYINQKNGTFKEVIHKATNHTSNFSMGNDIADFDNDGFVDILNLDMVSEDNYGMKTSMASMNPEKFQKNVDAGNHYQYMYNAFHKHSTHIDSTGVPFFSDVAQITGVANTDWSWAPLLADFDNDGLKDIFITNGIKKDFRNKDFYAEMQLFRSKNPDAITNPKKINYLLNKIPTRPQKNYFYKNNGGLSFENASSKWLPDGAKSFSNGAAYADLDNDGDLDLIINNVDEEATILRNNTDRIENNNFIKFEFKGMPKNTKGIGVKAILYTNSGNQLYENYPVRGYQSAVPSKLNIGIPENTDVDSVKIYWPLGEVQKIEISELNKLYTIEYDSATKLIDQKESKVKKMFSQYKITAGLRHIENEFNDYEYQVLLPHKLSQMGPAIAVGDVNKDGLEDLFLGQSSGNASQLYLQTKKGEFVKKQTFSEDKMFEDVDAVFFDFDNDGDLDLYVASGGNEFELNSNNYSDRLYENRSGKFIKRMDLLPKDIHISSSRINVEDINDDGYLDLFVGGRHNPRDYPSPATSYILLNNKGKFVDGTEEVAPELKNIGLVTESIWTDYDVDGDLDLLVVGEWMSPTIFENTNGKFEKIKNSYLDSISGWYYTVKALDIDNDGDDDYILGNLGENYKYKATKDEPFEMFYDDFDNNGSNDIVLGYYNFGELFPVRGKECSTQQVPAIKKTSPTYHDFGSSTIIDIYGDTKLNASLRLSSYNFKSGVLKNNGKGEFEFIPLPDIAQISSINDILLNDFNGDGNEDLIVAGNLFVSEIETPRNDAGYGMVLMNNGNFQFTPINASQSGLFLPFDSKSLNWIQIKNEQILISGNNNEKISSFKLNID